MAGVSGTPAPSQVRLRYRDRQRRRVWASGPATSSCPSPPGNPGRQPRLHAEASSAYVPGSAHDEDHSVDNSPGSRSHPPTVTPSRRVRTSGSVSALASRAAAVHPSSASWARNRARSRSAVVGAGGVRDRERPGRLRADATWHTGPSGQESTEITVWAGATMTDAADGSTAGSSDWDRRRAARSESSAHRTTVPVVSRGGAPEVAQGATRGMSSGPGRRRP